MTAAGAPAPRSALAARHARAVTALAGRRPRAEMALVARRAGAVTALAAGCLVCAVALAVRARRAAERVARAEHEIRGPATAIALLAERLRREPDLALHAAALEVQLDRLRAGLAELRAARTGRPAWSRRSAVELSALVRAAAAPWRDRFHVTWDGGEAARLADRPRLAQALGNLMANAAEHGAGPVEVRGRRTGARVEIEIRNGIRRQQPGSASRDRGRGLRIAADAARDAGGRVRFAVDGDAAVASLELPTHAGREPAPDARPEAA